MRSDEIVMETRGGPGETAEAGTATKRTSTLACRTWPSWLMDKTLPSPSWTCRIFPHLRDLILV